MSSSIDHVLVDDFVAPIASTTSTAPFESLWKRLFSFPVMLAVVMAATVYGFANRSIADPDIWWHLRNAEYFVQHHAVVRHDMYSFTASGAPWINEAWLSELPYYFAWRAMGMRGLYLVLLVCVEAILMGVFYLAARTSGNVKAAFVASWFAAVLATISFGPRTLLFGWICLVAELVILQLYKEGKDHTWFLPPLFLLWANCHGSWLIGLVFLCVFAGSGLVQGQWGRVTATRWTRPQLKKWIAVVGLSVLALFVNPYTYQLPFYPFDLAFQQKMNISHVSEWQSLDFHSARGKIVFGMVAITLILALARKRQWRLDEVGFALFAFYASFTYSRFMFLAAIVLTPLLALEMNAMPNYRRDIDKPLLNALIIAVLLGGCAWHFPSSQYLTENTVKEYPVNAMSYLQQFKPNGRVFNDYLWGGYLIWNVRQIPVFVDSRVDIFDHRGIFGDYLDAMGMTRSMEIFDKYQIRYVLYRKKEPMAYLLLHSPAWKVSYDDGTTVLFQRIGTIAQGNPH
jgi:hypothetical protein